MSKEQIEEMAKCCTYNHNGECCADVTNICDCDLMCEMFGVFANLEKAGYRKQSEGEWKLRQNGKGVCSNCHRIDSIDELANFCRYCGAKMRKEDEK